MSMFMTYSSLYGHIIFYNLSQAYATLLRHALSQGIGKHVVDKLLWQHLGKLLSSNNLPINNMSISQYGFVSSKVLEWSKSAVQDLIMASQKFYNF